ncbi:MAG: tRNA (N(6)-L-threonylcarbamoyladenosine(37)-C(2))-methylthiotransferase MtaB [Flavobacteriales bacterium]|mgnify:CR=1 FL=1|nr:tRNA (N(6)-L-threonylcarbamoyladenosine(37)-C(2))-methylthiotransferase MtaB [Flavobacteriales bacterium]
MIQYKKVAFHTLGCKLNFSETSTLARSFGEAGYARVEMEDHPDVLVINTCSVTEQADRKCRNIVSRAIRHNPGVYVAVIGCYAQLKPNDIAAIPGVDLVLGAGEKFNIIQHVEGSPKNGHAHVATSEIRDVKTFIPSYSSGDRTRTFLKVQDGCNYFCAFCTIPLARGRSRSAAINETLDEAKHAIASGAKEIVLTGVNIGDFGTAYGETLLQLVEKLDALQGVERFRISSIEPNLLTEDIIAFVASSKKFMPHFHIPLQSGSDEILSAMRRRYRTDLYRARIAHIKSQLPDCGIGVDVITGFPSESEERFAETRQFLLDLPISYLHVFTYSERDNTTALRLNDVVPVPVRHQRTQVLRMISEKKKRAFCEAHAGSTRPVLWEGEQDEGTMYGFTDNYIRVKTSFNASLTNTITATTLGKPDSDNVCLAMHH